MFSVTTVTTVTGWLWQTHGFYDNNDMGGHGRLMVCMTTVTWVAVAKLMVSVTTVTTMT